MTPKERVVGHVLESGEICEGAQLALIFPKRRNGFSEGWVAVSQNPMLELAKADLGGEASKVLFLILARLDFENWINLNQRSCAAEIGVKAPNFARALRKLETLGVLLVGPKVGRNATFRLNPHFGWKGSAKGHNEALRDRMKARGISVVGEAERDDRTRDMFESGTVRP